MKITVLTKEIELKEDQYLVSEDQEVILRKSFLIELAQVLKLPEPEIEYIPCGTDARASVYLCKATMTHGGKSITEWGEANPRSLKSDVAKEYPATIARSRAVNKLLLKVLGLNGRVQLEDAEPKVEIESDVKVTPKVTAKKATESVKTPPEEKTASPKETTPTTATQKTGTSLSKEEAGDVVMGFGATKGTKVRDFSKKTVEYILGLTENNYNKKLIAATKVYHA